MRPRQVKIKAGHYRVTVGKRSLDVVELLGRWYVNQFPEPPLDCGTSQSAAAFQAVTLLEADANAQASRQWEHVKMLDQAERCPITGERIDSMGDGGGRL